jgi:tetratricopeptide (TPR) repeat protein
MNRRSLSLALTAVLCAAAAGATEAPAPKRFEWTTRSATAKEKLLDVQQRIESFRFGADTVEAARQIVAADPEFAMGEYYLSAVAPPPENQTHLDKAVLLSKKASDGERRFVEAMVKVRANQGQDFRDGIAPLEALALDYPDERLVQVILGQLYQGANDVEKARTAFRRADAIGPKSARVRAFLANEDLLDGRYDEARRTFLDVAASLPKGAAPFAVRYGLAFADLYQGRPDEAIASLEKYVAEYRDSGAAQGFPEVFIWNSIARIQLENGRLDAAMTAYEKGYASVPGSSLPDDQKQVWLGRLRHGRCRVLARMGRHDEAWKEAQSIRKMIDDGGEAAKQYLPAWHYLAGYLDLEKGDAKAAVEDLKQASAEDPFHLLLLARAYEKTGQSEDARKTFRAIVESRQNGLERALAYPEAKRRLGM